MRFLRSFFDNDSAFGRTMTRCGILIASNLLFILFSLPVITAGASYAALYYVQLRVLRSDGELNPFRTFWQGFRDNFKQATGCWLLLLALAALVYLELFWCGQFTGPVALFRYALMAVALILLVIASYLFPTMAAFRATPRQLVMDSVYFAAHRPVTLLLVLFANVAPIVLTYVDYARLPLYAFLWCFIGFALVSMFNARLLLKLYLPYLSEPDGTGEAGEEPGEPTEEQILEDMKKLEM